MLSTSKISNAFPALLPTPFRLLLVNLPAFNTRSPASGTTIALTNTWSTNLMSCLRLFADLHIQLCISAKDDRLQWVLKQNSSLFSSLTHIKLAHNRHHQFIYTFIIYVVLYYTFLLQPQSYFNTHVFPPSNAHFCVLSNCSFCIYLSGVLWKHVNTIYYYHVK